MTWQNAASSSGLYGSLQHFGYGSLAYFGKAGSEGMVFYGGGAAAQGVTMILPRAKLQKTAVNGTPAWTELLTDQTPPILCPDMVYMPDVAKMVLFGGVDSVLSSGSTPVAANTLSASNATWTIDGTSWRREQQSAPPPARYCAAMVYLPDTQSVMLYGGIDRYGNMLQDTWQFSY